MHVQIDGKQVSPPEGYLIRKGPGNCYFDFAQEIVFASQQKSPMPTTVQTKMETSVRSVMCISLGDIKVVLTFLRSCSIGT